MKDTPLARAANNGHYQTCKFLIEQGAEVDALDIGDNTALHWAAMRGNVEIVNLLLQNGADKTIKNKQGLTCYEGLDRQRQASAARPASKRK